MEYLKLFENHSQYEDFIETEDFVLPNVSHCIEQEEVHYNPLPHDYAKDYLTFVALNDGTFTFAPKDDNVISYSLDNGDTWTELEANTNTPTVAKGKKILWKGEMTPSNGIGIFTSTGRFDVEGNVMSLLFGDNFKGQTDLTGYRNAFVDLFRNLIPAGDRYRFNPCYVVNAENFILPATILEYGCYGSMFYGCASLTIAPKLLATTLAVLCYDSMFSSCKNLITAPELPATEIVAYCYSSMFEGCTNLVNVPSVLPGNILKFRCYERMFKDCTSLTTAPEILATSMDEEDYHLGQCCMEMFRNCTSLTTAQSVLYPTTLIQGCYWYMFDGCINLTTAPELPATTLVDTCYMYMFRDCRNLNHIKCLATDISASTCLNSWVYNVASSGTFIKAANMTSWPTNVNGIPNGWTVQDAA